MNSSEPDHLDLLRAAFSPLEEAEVAWRRWRASQTVEDCPHTCHTLLAMLVRRLPTSAFGAGEVELLRGLTRYCWVRGQFLLEGGRQMLGQLAGAGVPALLLRGAGLGELPITDVSVMVPPGYADAGRRCLMEQGWTSEEPTATGCVLRGPQGLPFLLSWYASEESFWLGDDRDSWNTSVPYGEMRALAPELALLTLLTVRQAEPLRLWSEICALLQQNHQLDWRVVLAVATRRRVILPLRQRLRELQSCPGAVIPAWVETQLKAIRVPCVDRLHFQAARWPSNRLSRYLLEYRARAGAAASGRGLLRDLWGRLWGRPLGHWTGRAWRGLWQRRPGGPTDLSHDHLTMHLVHWEEWFAALRGRPGLKVLELGSLEGRSALWFVENLLTHPQSHLTCVDIFWHPATERRFDNNLAEPVARGQVRKVKESSHAWLARQQGAQFDLIYVDASHTARDVLLDALLCWRLLRPGGLLLFDDYLWNLQDPVLERPQLAVDLLLEARLEGMQVLHRGYQVLVTRSDSQ